MPVRRGAPIVWAPTAVAEYDSLRAWCSGSTVLFLRNDVGSIPAARSTLGVTRTYWGPSPMPGRHPPRSVRVMSSAYEPNDVGPAVGGDLRASDQDRDLVLGVIDTAFQEGRLTKEEHEIRTEAVLRAVTFDDLTPLTRDLVPMPPSHPGLAQRETRGPVVDPSGANSEDDNIVSIFSGTTRKGQWRARKRINMTSIFGGNTLDFTEAIWESDEIVLNCFNLFGGNEIKVPDGVDVEDQTSAFMGGNDIKVDPVPGAPRIVLKGFSMFGGNEVKGPGKKKQKGRKTS